MAPRILVADDEPHIREVVRAYLEREGYDVLEAFDGDSALELARSACPDLLILDVMLPGRSGFDVLRTLRSEGSTVGVVMLTARDDVIDRVAGLELGADDYVVKPFEPREVVDRVALTRTELDLLAALSEQPGRVWTREQIGERVFGESFDTYDRTIDSHVKNLRAKLGARPDGGSYVETVRGVGYRAARSIEQGQELR